MTVTRHSPAPSSVARAIARQSFCTLATSARDRPHVVGVLYVAVDGDLYVATLRQSKKARNVAGNPRVAVCIPVRRIPFVPPFLVQFAGSAQILAPDDPLIDGLARAGRLKKITAHGELDDPDGCFLRITPDRTVFTYGIGVSVGTLLRDPIHANRTFQFPDAL